MKIMIDCSKTENYFAEKRRMTKRAKNGLCKLGCSNCPLCSINNNKGQSCTAFEMLNPEKAIEIVQRWSNANPQRTYLTDLLEKYPNIPLDNNGKPSYVCPHDLGLMSAENCKLGLMSVEDCKKDSNKCVECWNQPMPAEGGEE
nr:hypothetical protein [Ruminococcus sp.]